MHWGRDPVLEKHYVPKRSQRARSVLTFFAQDTGTHNLVYASADISKATQNREVIAFCDHWKAVSGSDPKMLIMDQKVTTQAVLGELDERGVKFATLRMRYPGLMTYINGLTSKDYKTVALDRPGPPHPPQAPRSAPASAAATPPPPPTPSSVASSTAQEPSSPAATPSPSASTAAPTHPSSARPPSPPTPPSPGGTAVAFTSSSAKTRPNKLRGNPR